MESSAHNSRLSISTGTIVRFFVVLILIAALYYMSDVVLVILAAVVIASSIEPVVRRMRVWFHLHRVVSVIIIYLVLAAIIAGFVVFLLPLILSDAVNFLSAIPKTISLETLWSPIQSIGSAADGSSLAAHTVSVSDLIRGLQDFLVGSSSGIVQTVSTLFGGALGLILILVLSFYLAAQEDGVDDFLRIVTPVRHYDYIIDLWKRSRRKIGLWLQGQVLLGIIVGLLVYLVLTVVGIPHALLLAIFAGVLEIIPVFGPIVSAVPAIILAFADQGAGIGFLVVGLYLIIHQFENHLFYPLVVKKIVGISPIVVIVALVIGAKLAGILGALIAVPISAAFMEYVHDIEKYKKLERAERAVEKGGAL